ncbi:TPA: Lar family restriction alleviation protein [Pseudomonas aeruginosa]|nr:Lar family restriction alleviation protein [Pseudomonas aeruginosa]
MAEELKPCPCCGGEAVFVELDDGGMVAVCASRGCVASGVARYACGDEPRPLIAETWNARAAPAGHVVVSEGLLREVARHLGNWLELHECECDGGFHYCGRDQVAKTNRELRALLNQDKENGNG